MRQPPRNPMKNSALYILFLLIIIISISNFSPTNSSFITLDYSDFISIINKKDPRTIFTVEIGEREIHGSLEIPDPIVQNKNNTQSYRVIIPQNDPELMDILRKSPSKPKIKVIAPEQTAWWLNLLINWFPFLLLIGAWLYILNKMQGGGARAFSFGKSSAKMIDPSEKRIMFKDVAGVNEAKEDLIEVVDFLKEPKKFTDLGAKIPRGVLLFGPPGTGKTLLARAVAGEANVAFFNISASEFVEMFVGVGASRVRDLFEQARKNYPCIIFMDEIDAVGRHRGSGLGGGHDEREQTLNQLLVEMDGFDNTKGIILIAATNRPDVLDPALLRPGRFDRRIVVDQPDIKGREEILQIHVREKPLADDVDLSIIARRTPGFVGADLANLANEAAILAARSGRKIINMDDFEYAIDKVIAGSERKSRIISEKEKKNTAYHEMGHAIVASKLPDTDPVHKITIIPRGMALGLTMQLPVEDRLSVSKTHLKNQIAILLAGRVAESLTFNEISSGAANDIERATKIAKKMVCELGMSDNIGTVNLAETRPAYLGGETGVRGDISEDTARKIDAEIKSFIDWGYQKATEILTENQAMLEKCSIELLERETITGDEFKTLLDGGELPPMPESKKKQQSSESDSENKEIPQDDEQKVIEISNKEEGQYLNN